MMGKNNSISVVFYITNLMLVKFYKKCVRMTAGQVN